MDAAAAPPATEIVVIGPGEQPALRQQCYDVRIEVFVHEQGFALADEIDTYDDGATHFLLRDRDTLAPIGTIRAAHPAGAAYVKLGRLAVRQPYRKYHLGRALVLALHAWAAAHAYAEVVLHAQIPVVPFYAKYGYAPEGEEFDEDGAPHQKMVARLPLSD